LLSHLARLSVFHETGEPLPRFGSGHPNLLPHPAFQARRGWVFIPVLGAEARAPFFPAPPVPPLALAAPLPTPAAPRTNPKGAGALLEGIMAQRTVEDWMAVLEPLDVLCAPVNDYPQLVHHPAVRATCMIVEQEHPRAGRFTTMATPVKLEKTPGTIRTGAPAL